MKTSSLNWRLTMLYIAALAASFIAGAVYQGEKQPELKVETKTIVEYVDREVIKYVDRVVNKVKTQTITKKDGTIVTTREDTNTSENTSSRKTETELKQSESQTIVANPSKAPYSLGLEISPKASLKNPGEFLKSLSGEPDFIVNGGLRLGNTDFFITGSGTSDGRVGLGLRFDF